MKAEIIENRRRLDNLLLIAIRGYLINYGDIDECEIEIGNCHTARKISVFDDGTIEVESHYIDWDGEDYLATRTIEDMNTSELYNIWEYLENKFGI